MAVNINYRIDKVLNYFDKLTYYEKDKAIFLLLDNVYKSQNEYLNKKQNAKSASVALNKKFKEMRNCNEN